MTEGQVIKCMCVIFLCPGEGIETVALAARTCLALHYLTDIPRQREEYEVIYGTSARRNAKCHIISILRAGVEYLFYFMTNSRYIFVTK